MREIRLSGSEGGGAIRSPYPYQYSAPNGASECPPPEKDLSNKLLSQDTRC